VECRDAHWEVEHKVLCISGQDEYDPLVQLLAHAREKDEKLCLTVRLCAQIICRLQARRSPPQRLRAVGMALTVPVVLWVLLS
jgi:hypothetical protein